jgi:hypothetical protein
VGYGLYVPREESEGTVDSISSDEVEELMKPTDPDPKEEELRQRD